MPPLRWLLLLTTASLLGCERHEYTAVHCAGNLRQLWKLQQIYALQFGGPEKRLPSETGSEFWMALTRTKPPLIGELEHDILVCPVTGNLPGPGVTFRGPLGPASTLLSEDPIGCCEPGVHSCQSICVLLKNGTVIEVHPGNALYDKALGMTAGAAKK